LKSIFKKICIASDHAGYNLKENIKDFLVKKNLSTIDLGPYNDSSVDYPDFAKKVAKRVASKKSDVGILVCGSGTGMAISANKSKGIRAVQCYSKINTILSRQHNNANIICLGSRLIKKNDAFKYIESFLNTSFEGGRHNKRIKKI
tara:strand:- start:184 stop:621 length:438 start_codon:yes stop_codon:yes gene_type:complete